MHHLVLQSDGQLRWQLLLKLLLYGRLHSGLQVCQQWLASRAGLRLSESGLCLG